MYKELRERVAAYSEQVVVESIDDRLEPTLVALARTGMPTQPTRLDLSSVRWGGAPTPNVDGLAVQEDGTLHLEAQPPTRDAIVSDPDRWTRDVFQAEVVDHGPLVIEQGASDINQATYGAEGSTTTAVVNGWRWSATTGDTPALWAAPLEFWTPKPPVFLWWPGGNARVVVDDHVVKFWRFGTADRQVFLMHNQERWYIAVDSSAPEGPDPSHVHQVRTVLGFLFGEPINVGIFRPFGEGGVLPGLVHLGLMEHRAHRPSRQPPALPFNCSPTWSARFVDGLLRLADADASTPVLRVVHMYFAACSGFVESKFLHAWVATEMLARWGIEKGRFPDSGQRRLADHEAWVEWVKAHRADIEALAADGMGPRLFGRVLSSEISSPTRVQRAFEGLGLPWTPEMEDAQDSRHGVAHEGALPGDHRDWDRDRARVGLVKTMLTALLAKASGYDGPIADRSKTCFNINGEDEPDWWTAADLDAEVAYEGGGVAESRENLIAEFERLEAEEDEPPGDSTDRG